MTNRILILAVVATSVLNAQAPPNDACAGLTKDIQRFDAGDDQAASTFSDARVNACLTAEVRGEALVRMGRIQLAGKPPNLAAARHYADRVINELQRTNAVNGAYVLRGRLILEEQRQPRDFDEALKEIDQGRVSTGQRTPEASFYSGWALQLAGRYEEAAKEYKDAELRAPLSEWAARSLLGSASLYTRTGNFQLAMSTLQAVRDRFPARPEAKTALAWNSILYRIYLRDAAASAFQQPEIIKDQTIKGTVVALMVDDEDKLVVAHEASWSSFGDGRKLLFAQPYGEKDYNIQAMAFDSTRRVVFVRNGDLEVEGAGKLPETVQPRVQRPVGANKAVFEKLRMDVSALVRNWRGFWLFADRASRSIQWFDKELKYLEPPFAADLEASRLAIGPLNEVIALTKQRILVFGRYGKTPIGEIPFRGQKPDGALIWEIRDARDVAVDALGFIYVLDEGRRSIHVFSPERNYIRTFTSPAKNAGGFTEPKALVVGRDGRLYVLDDDDNRVLVYR